jgi:O-succinylbenzoic acid--CoA ligase
MEKLNYYQYEITVEGVKYQKEDFVNEQLPCFSNRSDFHLRLSGFLKEWYSENPFLEVKTSGSTGIPKIIRLDKERMINSALMTCSFLQLKEGDKALLCMSLDYIAGKMMVVRSLVAGLNLLIIEPDGHPLKSITGDGYDFSAMVPLQVYNSIKEKSSLEKIKYLIIGGGTIGEELEKELCRLSNNIYSSYGMTETLSHIALRKITGSDSSSNYIPLDGIKISLSKENTLVVDAPLLSEGTVYTNDIAEIYIDGSFKITGRLDNIINSGGIKIQPEKLEEMLNPLINKPFAISSVKDEKFGEIVVLVVETKTEEAILNELPQYYRPRKVVVIDKIPLTQTGKIRRKELKELINPSCIN